MFNKIWSWEVIGALATALYFTGIGIILTEQYEVALGLCILGVLLASVKFATWEETDKLRGAHRRALALSLSILLSLSLIMGGVVWAKVVENREPDDSLRKRILKVTSQMYWTIDHEARNRPPECADKELLNESSELQTACTEYDTKMKEVVDAVYRNLIQKNTVAVLHELKAKGLDPGQDIEDAAKRGMLNGPEIARLREFAWHLDRKDNVVRIGIETR